MPHFILSVILLMSSAGFFGGTGGLGAPGFVDVPALLAAAGEPVFTASPIGSDVYGQINGVSWKQGCPVPIDDLRLLKLTYVDFDRHMHVGELICHRAVADDLLGIFSELYEAGFPIERIRLIDAYGADDLLSMEDNNSSAFNYRTVSGTANLSKHAYGVAVDINPVQNPYTEGGGAYVSPEGGRAYLDRSDARPGMIVAGGAVYEAFASRGWKWGGDWIYQKDYQHFQKDILP